MSGLPAEIVSLALLAATLGFAVLRPRGLPEAVLAVPAAAIVLGLGMLSQHEVRSEIRGLAPTVAFLAAVLVLAELADRHGLFAVLGSWIGTGSRGGPVRLLGLVFAIAAVVTAVLSLDATVVLFTPVVFRTVTRLRLRSKPHVYACTHMANSGSLLLPVSNLTNLLAFKASGLSFARFGAIMALPWLAAIAAEWVVMRRFFASDLVGRGSVPDEDVPVPWFALAVVALTLAGFFATSVAGISPAYAALAGALALGLPALAQRRVSAGEIATALDLPFLAFVFALGVVVAAVSAHGLQSALERIVPGGSSLPALLAIAFLAALVANVVNNLPAVLLLLPAVGGAGAGPVLALLIGVNVGPNLAYVGSLATLLWRRILQHHGVDPSTAEFLRLGAISVPITLAAATIALWISLQVVA
jgi:arsenical pump membrane protein